MPNPNAQTLANRHLAKLPRERGLAVVAGTVGQAVLLGLVLWVPWIYGSARWSEQRYLYPALLLVVAACLLATHAGRRPIVNSWPSRLVLILVALTSIQILPLPEALWTHVSAIPTEVSALDDQMSLWGYTDTEMPRLLSQVPRTVSVNPEYTRAALSMLCCGMLVFLCGSQLFCTRRSLVVLLATIACAGLAFSTWGLILKLNPDSLTSGLRLQNTSFSTFYNANTVAQYLASAVGAVLGLMMYALPKLRMGWSNFRELISSPIQLVPILTLSLWLAVLFLAIAMANSRGGTVATLLAVPAVALVVFQNRQSSQAGSIVLLSALLLIGLFVLPMLGGGEVAEQLSSLNQELYDRDNVRIDIWRMVVGRPESWTLGGGLGAFQFGVLSSYPQPERAWFYHGESLYFEMLYCLGPLGLLSLLAIIISSLATQVRLKANSRALQASALAASFPLIVISINSVTDFGFVVPAVWLPFTLLMGAFWGQKERATIRVKTKTRRKSSSANRKRESHKAPTGRGKSSFRFLQSLLVVGILCVIGGLTWPSVHALSKAEAIAKGLMPPRPSSSSAEVRLQSARAEQAEIELFIAQHLDGLEGLPQTQLASLKNLGVITAVLRGTDPAFGELQTLFEPIREDLDSKLGSNAEQFASVLTNCPVDWRASWGILRTGVGNQRSRASAFAGLTRFGKCASEVLDAAAFSALLAGEKQPAFTLLRQVLPTSFGARSRLPAFVPALLSVDEMLQVFPEDAIQLAEVARQFDTRGDSGLALRLLDSIRLDKFNENSADASDYELLSWAASMTGDLELQTQFLSRAATAAPSSHRLSYELAVLLRERGQLEEALVEIEHAAQLRPDIGRYRMLAEELGKLLQDKP